MSDEALECPNCGCERFSWIVKTVQFGSVHETENGYYEEGLKNGDVIGSDIPEHGVYCTGCDDFYDRDDLVKGEE